MRTRARPADPALAVVVAAALALPLGLAGCAGTRLAEQTADAALATSRYIAPAAGQPAARLLLRGSQLGPNRLALLRHADAQACQQPQLLWGQPAAPGGTGDAGAASTGAAPVASSVRVAAGELTTLELVEQRPDRTAATCLTVSFAPQNGGSYLLQLTHLGASCSLRLLDVTQPDRPRPPPDARLRSLSGQRCAPLAQSRAMAAPSLDGGQDAWGDAVLNPQATTQPLRGLMQP